MENEGQIWPLFGDSSMGNRTHYTICENNLILCEGSSGADYNSIAYYQIEPHAYTATCSEAIVQDGLKYYFATEDSYEFSYISEANQNDYESYYQIEPHAYTATCSEAIVQDGLKYYFATEDSYEFSYISEANQNDYESFTTHHLAKEDIQWLKLSEF